MGVVYKAHDPDIDRPLAIKLVRADLLGSDERADYIARFRREAQAAGRCVHGNIVAIYDFALHEGNPFLAMEFVEGASLAQYLDRGTKFTSAQSVAIIAQVLDALACAHDLGIVHRDIKPANVMLLADWRVKVTDFGISRLEGSDLTDVGSVVGTPSYMSPEQCRGQPVDARSDLFSTGAVLYQLLAGARPFAGRTVAEITQKLLHAEPPDLSPLLGPAGARLKRVVDRALAKRPEDRFASALAMRQALLPIMGAVTAAPAPPGASARTSPGDGTVVLPAAPSISGVTPRFDPRFLSGIERALASHIGPIARHLVQSGARKATSTGELCATLTQSIDDPGERTRFLQAARALARDDAAGLTSAGPGASRSTGLPQPAEASHGASAISEQDAEYAARALARYLGPIAKVLVKRARPQARSREELWTELARHIESARDRAAFLRDGAR